MAETYIKTGDFKGEKHVPVIEAPATAAVGEKVHITVSVGKDIPHPNTTEHHINWIKLYFIPGGTQVPFEVANVEFNVHGESVKGANEGPAYAEAEAVVVASFKESGKLLAASYCNIHGLWKSEEHTITVG